LLAGHRGAVGIVVAPLVSADSVVISTAVAVFVLIVTLAYKDPRTPGNLHQVQPGTSPTLNGCHQIPGHAAASAFLNLTLSLLLQGNLNLNPLKVG